MTAGIVRRAFVDGATRSEALYSPCELYRYGLERIWGESAPLMFVMLNPSTATERANDPTIHRCETRARRGGYGGLLIANLFAFRATKPADLRAAPHPVGEETDAVIAAFADRAGLCVAGWGVHGALLGRGAAVTTALRARLAADRLAHLGLTRDGHPRHPLYVAYATGPQPWAESIDAP